MKKVNARGEETEQGKRPSKFFSQDWGTGNKGLYITGGVCLVAGMALKQLGSVKGARKRLGQ